MKRIFLILSIIQIMSCSAQEQQLPVRKKVALTRPEKGIERREILLSDKDSVNIALFELTKFIQKRDSISMYYTGKGNQYAVYVLNIYKQEPHQQGFCFTLSYIMNSFEYNKNRSNYYINIDDEIVLVYVDNFLNKNYLDEFNLMELDEDAAVRAVQKLYPSVLGGYTYHPMGMLYCRDGEKIESTYYDNADEIPYRKSIHTTFPEGNIELIKEGEK